MDYRLSTLIAGVLLAAGSAQASGVNAGAQRSQGTGGSDRRIGIVGTGDITFYEHATDFFGDLLAALFIEVGDNDFGTRLRQLPGSRLTDAGGTAGNNG